MTKWSHLALRGLVLAAGCLVAVGCTPTPTGNPPAPVQMTFPPPGGGGSPVQQIMRKFEKGSDPLWTNINKELNNPQTPWNELQTQTKDFAGLAVSLGNNPPPRGSKESWDQHTQEFIGITADLRKAAEDKDLDNARKAQIKVTPSCDACHKDHRGMRPQPPG